MLMRQLRLLLRPPNPFLVRFREFRVGSMNKVYLKWARNNDFDDILIRNTETKAAFLFKDAILRSPTGFLSLKSFSKWRRQLGLTFPVLRFARRYPSLFHEFPHPMYPKIPCFRLTDTAKFLDSMEKEVYESNEIETVERLCKVLMMAKSRMIPYNTLLFMRWDLGLPDNFQKNLIPKYPDHFRPAKTPDGITALRLTKWRDELAVSALQRANETQFNAKNGEEEEGFVRFKRGIIGLTYRMSFPRHYDKRPKVKSWIDQFNKLPYVSPYEDSSVIASNSDLMEKRVVGVLHEILSLTLHKKTHWEYLRLLADEYNLPTYFTRVFSDYPGIFYAVRKCRATHAVLCEGYKNQKLVEPHPLTMVRDKFRYAMRIGLLYRSKGEDMISEKDLLSKCKSGNVGLLEEFLDESDEEEEFSDMVWEEDENEDED